MGVDRLPVGDDKTLRRKRLQPDVVGSGRNGPLDARRQQLLERREQDVLQLDGQRQQAIEESGDRRQLVLDPIAVGQGQAGRLLKSLERAILDLAIDQQQVELAQGVAGVKAFEIVLRPEQPLPSGLALALGDGAERVEAAGNRREEAFLGLHIGGDRPEQRRLRLIGAVGPPQALNGGVGLPPGLQQIVDAQAPVLRREFGVIGAPRAAGVGKDEDALDVIHESLGLSEIGRTRAVLDDEAVNLRPIRSCG